jgi:hypothetical protein
MWRTQTCFPACSSPADCFLGYDNDGRPECNKTNRNDGLYCVMPEESCEDFVTTDDVCANGDYTTCLNWQIIIVSIVISNIIQFIFEATLLNSLEITYAPTPLE